jgi:alpha/beta hydrolase family protein
LIILVHSPLLGPYTWETVARLLRADGHAVAVPDLRPALAGPPLYLPHLCDAVASSAASAGGQPVTLVAHSAAGPLLPAVAEAMGPAVENTIFLDARLPHPGISWLDSLAPGRADSLREMVTDGRIPPWDTWFPAEALASEIPQPEIRERFRAELRPTPFGLYEEVAASPAPAFDRLSHTYVRLSPAYDDAAATAERAEWRVVRRDSTHLAPLSAPDEIAAIIGHQTTASRQT